LLLGQIGVDMTPCEGNCAFCFFAKSHTSILAAVLPEEEIIARCERFAAGGARGVFRMTMRGCHRVGGHREERTEKHRGQRVKPHRPVQRRERILSRGGRTGRSKLIMRFAKRERWFHHGLVAAK